MIATEFTLLVPLSGEDAEHSNILDKIGGPFPKDFGYITPNGEKQAGMAVGGQKQKWIFGKTDITDIKPETTPEPEVKEQDPVLAALVAQTEQMQTAILELTSKVLIQPSSRKLVIHRDKDNRMSEIEEVMV